VDLLLQQALSLQESRRHDEALRLLDHILSTRPHDSKCLGFRAVSLAALDRLEEAAESARLSIECAPESSFGYFCKAKVLICKGDPFGARKAARRAIELAPSNSDNFAVLASTYVATQNWRKVLDTLDAGLRLDPTNRAGLFLKATSLRNLGKSDEATEALRSLLTFHPNFAPGVALLEEGNWEAPRSEIPIAGALQLDPQSGYARSVARSEILRRSRLTSWIASVQGLMMRVGMPRIIGAIIPTAIVVHLGSRMIRGEPLESVIRLVSITYGIVTFAVFFSYSIGEIRLRFHTTGRWVMSRLQRIQAEVCLSGCVTALLALAGGLASGRSDLNQVALGILGWSFAFSSSLRVGSRLASIQENLGTATAAFAVAASILDAFGGLSWTSTYTMMSLGLVGLIMRIARWPKVK
jgi:Flp pilus assembly protein TadD